MSTKKVLLSGDCLGRLPALFKRVASVNKSNGPFDMLLCVGSFFPTAGPEGDADECPPEVMQALTQNAPVPTYFIGSYGQGSQRALEALELAPDTNMHYLGRSGLREINGLSIAYLDGLYSKDAYSARPADDAQPGCRHFNKADMDKLRQAVNRATGDVDILLTCEWPRGVTLATPPASLPDGVSEFIGSEVIAELAAAVRPRYHVSGTHGTFYARQPYLNPDLGAGSHVTRFIGLAPVGNPSKAKSLHALGLVPASQMDTAALQTRPEGTTKSPYLAAAEVRDGKRGREDEEGMGEQSWRWQQAKKPKQAAPSMGRPGVVKDDARTVYVKNMPFRATEEDLVAFFGQVGAVVDVRRGINSEGQLQGFGFIQFDSVEAAQRALELHDAELMGRQLSVAPSTTREKPPAPDGKPVAGCWFCLSNEGADVNLIASIGEESYVAVDKGAISEAHVLVLPIEHMPCSLAVSPACWAEMERYLTALRACYAAQGQELVAFERYMTFRKKGGNHCHINVLGIPTAAAKRARQAFEEAAAAAGFSFEDVPAAAAGEAGRAAVRQLVGDSEYLLVILPGGGRLVHLISRGERHPLNFGRDVVAGLAGAPERGDWKNCQLAAAEEAARTERFKALFKPYDIMQ